MGTKGRVTFSLIVFFSFLFAFFLGFPHLKSLADGYSSSGGGTDTGTDLTTKGDIHTYDTAQQRLAVGADDQCLIADSTEATGLKWGACGTGESTESLSPTGTTFTCDFDTYTRCEVEMNGASGNLTATFTAPTTNPKEVCLATTQGATARTITFPVAVKFPSGIQPPATSTDDAIDQYCWKWDGSIYNSLGSNMDQK